MYFSVLLKPSPSIKPSLLQLQSFLIGRYVYQWFYISAQVIFTEIHSVCYDDCYVFKKKKTGLSSFLSMAPDCVLFPLTLLSVVSSNFRFKTCILHSHLRLVKKATQAFSISLCKSPLVKSSQFFTCCLLTVLLLIIFIPNYNLMCVLLDEKSIDSAMCGVSEHSGNTAQPSLLLSCLST